MATRIGDPGNNNVAGTSGNDSILGLQGNDTIQGLGGGDVLVGGMDNDLIIYGSGVFDEGFNLIFGDEDADTVTSAGNAGNNTILGGTGNAAIDSQAGKTGDGNDLIDASADTGNDLILGNYGDDAITVGPGSNTVSGGMGNDTISAGDGDNLIFGNEGSDSIMAGNGNNTIVGGQDSTDGADLIRSGSGNDLILGNGGNDTIASGAGNDSAGGGYGADLLLGNQGGDILLGNQGDDTLYGGMGNDTLYGGMNNDRLIGGEGNDFIVGGEGDDTASFSGTRASYAITQNQDGSYILTGASGSDTVSSVERFQFDDGTLDAAALISGPPTPPTVNRAPVVTAGHTLAYTENQAATAIDPALIVSDADSTTLGGAKVQITGNYLNGQDLLAFTPSNGSSITSSFDTNTGTLTLTGNASVNDYQAALRSVTYSNSSQNPSANARTITVTATDSGGAPSSPVTDTINVTPVNDAPTATGLTQSLAINEDAAATTLFTQAPTVDDADSNAVTATLTLANASAGGLAGGGFAPTATPGQSGQYSFTGTAAQVQSALGTVTFGSAANYNGSTSLAVSISDSNPTGTTGAQPSGSVSINVTPVNDAPMATHTLFSTTQGTEIKLHASDFGFTDPLDAASASGSNTFSVLKIVTVSGVGQLFYLNNDDTPGGRITEANTPVALDAYSGVVWRPPNNGYGTFSPFSFAVQDNGGTANGGNDTSAVYTASFNVAQIIP